MAFSDIPFFRLTSAVILATCLSASLAHADDDDDDEDDGRRGRTSHIATNAKWQAECGACHLAYPPRFLPAASWRAMMRGLDKHFGSDASLDTASAREIGKFLDSNAGRERGSSGQPLLRITESDWFLDEHDEVSARTWKNPKVKSPANCAACHTLAERGDYNEHNIRIPR